jgi:glycosyltransferase involved in cell wall biosynthesis
LIVEPAMKTQRLRVVYMPDSFHEVNGVAHTSRNFQAYAERKGLPFLCIRAGRRDTPWLQQNELRTLEHKRNPISLRLEKDLYYDPLYLRYAPEMLRRIREFRPDVVHITGPSELGMLGAWMAWKLGVPLAASWHTNVHEYLARRSARLLGWLPRRYAATSEQWIEDTTLAITARFYRLARVLFAPNRELCDLLASATGKPCALMQRGVDTTAFSPTQRTRTPNDGSIVIGYVGRLSVEKNIALLLRMQADLHNSGFRQVRFLIVGHGGEEQWMRQHLPNAEFTGVLRGEALQQAYANMDIFAFPSHTDTFGNVVLEALASGVPAIVTPDGGPKYIVQHGVTGFVADDDGFTPAVEALLRDPQKLASMRRAAREYAETCSWDAVFDRVYDAYAGVLAERPA